MDGLTELYCLMDDFCKEFEPALKARLIADGKVRRHRLTRLSEVAPFDWTEFGRV